MTNINRSDWLKLKRRATEERYDRLWAPIYDENWGSEIGVLHQQMLSKILDHLPSNALSLDAACGTGKYWPMLTARGCDFVGIDQSAKMLQRATQKFPRVPTRKVGLQELHFKSAFDLIMCIDAMENVFPEEWPLVLGNFHRALKPSGWLYFTVEIAEPSTLEPDYQAALAQGLPVVYGESASTTGPGDEEGGYHYYPAISQVCRWLDEAGFSIREGSEAEDYHHFWVVKGSRARQ
jgi:SAM-dependent methyltransferase